MALPQDLRLSADELRYLRPSQLANLTKIHATYFSAWSSDRSISERNLAILAQSLRLSKAEILEGFELRRADLARANLARQKADELIAYLQAQKESA